MGDMKEDFQAMQERHKKRVEKTPDRLIFALKQLNEHGIRHELKNGSTGHVHAWRKSDNALFQFYAGTGKILGHDFIHGIDAFIKLLENEEE